MKKYRVVLERTLFSETTIEADSPKDAMKKAWEAADRLLQLQPITDSLGEVEVYSVEVVE